MAEEEQTSQLELQAADTLDAVTPSDALSNVDGDGSNLDNSAPQPTGGEDDLSGKIFVGGLSWNTTEERLRYYFEKFGEIEAVDLMIDKKTGQPRCVHGALINEIKHLMVFSQKTHSLSLSFLLFPPNFLKYTQYFTS